MITIESSGSFRNTERFLQKMSRGDIFNAVEGAAKKGVSALQKGTPKDSGITADSWGYEIKRSKSQVTISWTNSSVAGGKPLVIMLQYGHGTGTGGYVKGRDFINPALRPVFDEIANDVWKAVTSA
jgi:hypothetical protein